MGGIVFFIFYGSLLFFFVATAVRVRKCIAAPLHLRWELYKEGSIYEMPDWWLKTQSTFARKFGSMILDLLFLRDFYRRNRRFWYFLYPFHLGVYLLILWHAFFLFNSLVIQVIESASIWGRSWGHVATGLTFVGSVGIFIKRVQDEDLKVYYPSIHYLKWLFLIIILLEGFYAVQFYFDSIFEDLLLEFHPHVATPVHLLLASMWLIYLPFSHVFQLFFRYYHHLRWDDVPNRRGSEIEKKVKGLLDRPVTWSGPHIPSGKRWSEVASEVSLTSGTGTK